MKTEIRILRRAMLDLTGVLNRPQPDAALIAAAGVDLDRALFPLLVRIEIYGPIGIVELSELAGRDYSTVSRQVTKLEDLDLVERTAHETDARIRRVALSDKGRVMTKAIDAAREKLVRTLLKDWDVGDVKQLAVLLRRFADGAMEFVGTLPVR